jgi:hypothetical protein
VDDLVQEIGLLLTQMRYARRALEDIERSTSRYNSFAFAAALSQGAKWSEPPMFGGSLKVWIVNINDLAPGAGGGFLEQLLGGVGRFIGGVGSGFAGGVLGGLFGGWNLPDLIDKVKQIVDAIDRIMARLGISFDDDKKAGSDKDKKDKKDGPSLVQQLQGYTSVFQTFTSLLLAGAGQPEKAQTLTDSLTPGAQEWMRIVETTLTLVSAIDRVVEGLVILLPMVIGTLADFVYRLDTIKLAIIDLLQFLVREILLLRGILLVTLFDTISAAAQLAAGMMSVLGVAFGEILTSIFGILGKLLDGAVAIIQFLAQGLVTTVNSLATWLVGVINGVLSAVATSPLFIELVHVIEQLPKIIPPLAFALQGDELPKALQKSLDAVAASPAIAGIGAGPATLKLPNPPDIPKQLVPDADAKKITDQVTESLRGVRTSIDAVFGSSQSMLKVISGELNDAAKDGTFTSALNGHIAQIRSSSKGLADAFDAAQKSTLENKNDPGSPVSGIALVAQAYEKWLSGDGMHQLLDNVTDYFKRPGAADALRDKAIGATTIDRPRATIDIQDVIINVAPPPAGETRPSSTQEQGLINPAALQTPEDLLEMFVEMVHEYNERGYRIDEGSPLTQV